MQGSLGTEHLHISGSSTALLSPSCCCLQLHHHRDHYQAATAGTTGSHVGALAEPDDGYLFVRYSL